MNEIVLNRLKEVCPVEKLGDLSSDEIEMAVNIAFKIIGYKPIDKQKAIQKATETSTATWLCDFIFDVWRCDDGS